MSRNTKKCSYFQRLNGFFKSPLESVTDLHHHFTMTLAILKIVYNVQKFKFKYLQYTLSFSRYTSLSVLKYSVKLTSEISKLK